jgi:hypothetical protein
LSERARKEAKNSSGSRSTPLLFSFSFVSLWKVSIYSSLLLPFFFDSIARYTPANKTRQAFLQILDYNIQRLEVKDRRGLEILILTAICTLLDLEYDEKYKDGPSGNIYMAGERRPDVASNSDAPQGKNGTFGSEEAASTGQQGFQTLDANELVVDTPLDVYIQHVIHLLRQDQGGEGLHLVILKALSPQVTPKAVRLAAEIKVNWHRLEAVAKGRTLDPLPGSTSEIAEELYQYVRDPSTIASSSKSTGTPSMPTKETSGSSARPRIKLDAPSLPSSGSATPISGHTSPAKNQQKAFAPPPNQLDIYLSKERIDEFEVGPTAKGSASTSTSHHALTAPLLSKSRPLQTPPTIPPKETIKAQSETSAGGAKKIFDKLKMLKGHHPSE